METFRPGILSMRTQGPSYDEERCLNCWLCTAFDGKVRRMTSESYGSMRVVWLQLSTGGHVDNRDAIALRQHCQDIGATC